VSSPPRDPSQRAVVTGIGAVTPVGNTATDYWRNLVDGVSGAATIASFDPSDLEVRIAAEVKGFDPTIAMDRKMARRMSRFIHFAMASAEEAISSAGLDLAGRPIEERDRMAVVINTGGGGLEQVINGTETLATRGSTQVSPFAIPALSGSMGAAQVSMKYGITGPVMTQVAACASSIICFQDALRLIRGSEADVVIAGGSEAPILPVAVAALSNMGALSKRNDEPTKASRPFDLNRDGFVLGEGGAIAVVESLAHALDRGAPILCELVGAALTADAFHISAPEPSGRGASEAMRRALVAAGLAPGDIDLIVAHGTSTPLNDVTETRAIKSAFGEAAYRVAITSPKSMVGHLVGGAGAVSAIAGICAIRDGIVPPTINLETPDPECDLDYTPKIARRMPVGTAMVNGFGFGGQNAVAVFRRYDG
jgi:3-oxoacyl-[acyl-carrier-protein] synthase II